MIAAIQRAEQVFAEEMAQPVSVFDAWLSSLQRMQEEGREHGWTTLLSSFGVSMVERALLDAVARRHRVGFSAAVRKGLYGIRAGEVHPELAGASPAEWLPAKPADQIHVRHTIGLSDPLTAADISPEDLVNDGRPQALEDYVTGDGISYIKIKVSNQLEQDLERLREIAGIVQLHRDGDYHVTLDGNEQYTSAAEVTELVDRIESDPQLVTLWKNVILIEQPLARDVALDQADAAGIGTLGARKPVIIDESDGELHSAALAMQRGYRGTSSKCCKGPLKSILNAGLIWLKNDHGQADNYLMTGEDLCTLGVVSVQADLCLVNTLGLSHVEKNGHHFMPGLSYLPSEDQQAALAAHGDFYEVREGVVMPAVRDGQFQIESLSCPGFGFSVVPDIDQWISAADWEFSSLGLEE